MTENGALESYSWLFRLLYNLLGYLSIGGPVALFVWYAKNKKLFLGDQSVRSWRVRLVRFFVHGNPDYERVALEAGTSANSPTKRKPKTSFEKALVLLFCFFGLQVSYLTWGVFQEKIMTQTYRANGALGTGERFRDSQFLVFVNKLLGFLIASVYLYFTASSQPQHTAPFYRYSYCAMSNIVSSWCQYEALKFVSFPTQILAKSSKIIPVMLMGKVVSRKKYSAQEYFSAAMISFGMFLFLMGKPRSSGSQVEATTIAGALLLFGYICSDAFTSNWQGRLFSKYKMSSIQMMCGVNFFSASLTFVTLLQQGSFGVSVPFLLNHRDFAFDCLLQSICSASGQVFVFYTISQFGPVIFVTMMTIRQAVAILLSCLIYGHRFGVSGLWGIFFVFLALSVNVFSHFMKHKSKERTINSPVKCRSPKSLTQKAKEDIV